MSKTTLSIGSIRLKTGKNKQGEEFSYFEVDLRQNVDILVNGEKVNFSSYTLDDGKQLQNKKLSVTPVDIALKGAKDKMSEQDFQQLSDRYKKQNVQYTLSIASRNLA